MNILHFIKKNHTINILQSLICNSLLLAPCIVRTFEKTLTVVDIIKFSEEDEMKYLIVEHSSGKYFGFNLRESNERTSAISIVQDKDEFMVMGWKVTKVIPTFVLGFVDWNNLMTSYNATLSQDIEMVNTNDVFYADNVNVGNNYEVNWCEKEIEDHKIKSADPLYVGDCLFQGDDPQNNDNHDVTSEAISSKEGCSGYKQEVTSHQPVSNPYSSIKIETSQATLIPSLMLMLTFLIYVVELSRRNFQPILQRLSS
jgi:hypothetical protein